MDIDRLQRLIMWVTAVSLVVGTVLALRFVRGYRPLAGLNYPSPTDMPADVALRFDSVRVVGRKDNKPAWTLTAGQVQTDRTHSNLDFSKHVTATLLDSGNPRAVITAPVATYDGNARILMAAGRLEARVYPKASSKSGVKSTEASAGNDLLVEAEEAQWNVGTHTISCRGPVHATMKDEELYGNDVVVDLLTRDLSINQFRATIMVDDSGQSPIPPTLEGPTQ